MQWKSQFWAPLICSFFLHSPMTVLVFFFFFFLSSWNQVRKVKSRNFAFVCLHLGAPSLPTPLPCPRYDLQEIFALCNLSRGSLFYFSNPVLKTIIGGFWKFPISCQVKDLNKNSSCFFFIEMNLICILTDWLSPNMYFSLWFLVFHLLLAKLFEQ